MLAPTRNDKIRDKLLAIGSLTTSALKYFPTEDDRFNRFINEIGHAYKELDLYVKTPEVRGRKMGLWK